MTMTTEHRVQAVVASGFPARHAPFLVDVLLHAGVCVPRQYCARVGVRRGKDQHRFFARLEARGVATRYVTHRRGVIYHVHHKALYRAIGEPESRFRKPVALARAIERLIVLDGVLAAPDLHWLATAAEKTAYFTQTTGLAADALPRLRFGTDASTVVRAFPDRLPIGVCFDGRTHCLLYGITQEAPLDFRAFLHRHHALLRALPAWEIRLLVPPHLATSAGRYEAAAREELQRPLRLDAIWELHTYFAERQRVEQGQAPVDPVAFARAREQFRAPRFFALYRSWQAQGDTVLDAQASSVLADTVERGRGRVTSQVMPHKYLHLATLVGTA